MADKIVHLGIPRLTTKKSELAPRNFPSTFGLYPVWIFPKPKSEVIACEVCKEPMVFLLQIYAPIDELPEAYHRMLYVFACANKKCAKSGKEVKVLRCQADENAKIAESEPKKGKWKAYVLDVVSEEPEVTQTYMKRIRKIVRKACDPFYKCAEEEKGQPEEDLLGEELSSKDCEYETKLWEEYLAKEKTKAATLSPTEIELEQFELEMVEKVQLDREREDILSKDEGFDLFQLVCNKNPKQVLRYTKHYPDAVPLWYQSRGLKKIYASILKDSEKCKHCGGPMVFEMQIMPQLFNYIKATLSVDWGTIVIYTYLSYMVTNNIGALRAVLPKSFIQKKMRLYNTSLIRC